MIPELTQSTKYACPSNQLKHAQSLKKWYIFYLYPKAEKIVYQELVKRNYEVFLPITKSLRQWKNRQKKWIEQVLFPGYIFVNTLQCEIYEIAKVSKVVSYLCCGGIPSVIQSKEIEGIKKMLDLNQNISVETNFSVGQEVRVIYGPLAGYEGILIREKEKSRFGIQLKEINHTVFIDICSNFLEKI